MGLSKRIKKDAIYLSFPDVNGKLVNEYIPKDPSWLFCKYSECVAMFYAKKGIETYYWNLRYLMYSEMLKQTDLQFIMHVLQDHDGSPESWRERRFYNKLAKRYYYDIEWIIRPMLLEAKSKSPIVHPYYLAYKKRWLVPKDPNFKRAYHGLNNAESVEIINAHIDQISKRRKRYYSKRSYYKKQIK